MKKIIIANWKMNNGFEEADSWFDTVLNNISDNREQIQNVEIVVCPPFFMIDYIDSELMNDGFYSLEQALQEEQKKTSDFSSEELTKMVIERRQIKVGAQDCHHELSGSYTGDVSASMLKQVGCEYVIIGHSERRSAHFENNEIISKKIRAALSQNLIPVICVGESQEIRDQKKHLEFVYSQIMQSVPKDIKFKKMVIAYEPIWSIGTGVTPELSQISEMTKLIKKIFREKLPQLAEEFFMLYGGSVSAQNSEEILAITDGLLIGKASLDAEEFFQICTSSSAF